MLERARAWLRSLRMVAATAGPGALLDGLRHRRELRRVTRALHYPRFASALLLAHELGVFEALARGAGTADAVAAACGIGAAPAEALLRIVESEGMVQRGPDGGFALRRFR